MVEFLIRRFGPAYEKSTGGLGPKIQKENHLIASVDITIFPEGPKVTIAVTRKGLSQKEALNKTPLKPQVGPFFEGLGSI